ncbi:VOC family protein [Zavarzinia sp.]|uniref:VOC family protein n=1 Tax=Zavarzinia sp. TaxID=2027920 RepID=UPI00356559F6
MPIKLQLAYVVTPDMAAQRAFYEEVLGLPLKFQDGTRWAQFDTGGANFALAAPEEAPAGATGTILVFQVDDLDATVAALTAAGVAVDPIRDMGTHGRVTSFRDPAGNRLQLFGRAAP